MPTSYSPTEREVILLRVITDLIDSMVNRSIFNLAGESPTANILFHTTTHQQLFNILLVDLLSKPDTRFMTEEVSYLDAIAGICNQPNFDVSSSVTNLRSAVSSLTDWLAFEPTVTVWFPSADAEVSLTLSRSTFITLCGNISKHSTLRQSHSAEKLRTLLKRSGLSLTLDKALLALEDFYERFHVDIFNYHASRIAELLNEIQWSVYEYLLPEYLRSYVSEGGSPERYHFCYPDAVQSDLAKSLYWDLMNWIRRKPIMGRFIVTKHLKIRY